MVNEEQLTTQCQRVLSRLRQGPMNNLEGWAQVGIYRISARIHDLRNAGYNIETKRITASSTRFAACSPSFVRFASEAEAHGSGVI